MVRWSALLMCCALVAGCAMPPSLRVASWAVDGLTYIATDKSVMDHGLSALSGRDCKMLRVASAKAVCLERTPGIDFNGNLQDGNGVLAAKIAACDIPDIAAALPDDGGVRGCAQALVERFGAERALTYSEWHITQSLEAGRTDDAGVWVGVLAAVRRTLSERNG